jgi:hypothetical protein
MTERLPQPSLTPETIDVDPIKQFSRWLVRDQRTPGDPLMRFVEVYSGPMG